MLIKRINTSMILSEMFFILFWLLLLLFTNCRLSIKPHTIYTFALYTRNNNNKKSEIQDFIPILKVKRMYCCNWFRIKIRNIQCWSKSFNSLHYKILKYWTILWIAYTRVFFEMIFKKKKKMNSMKYQSLQWSNIDFFFQ